MGTFMDGGTVYNIDPEGAVRQCLDGVVDSESKIIMDIMICRAHDDPEYESASGNTIDNFLRGRKIRKYFTNTDTISYFL